MRIAKISGSMYLSKSLSTKKESNNRGSYKQNTDVSFGGINLNKTSVVSSALALLLSFASCAKKNTKKLPERLSEPFRKALFEKNPSEELIGRLTKANYLSKLAKNSYTLEDENLIYYNTAFSDSSRLALTKDNCEFGRVKKIDKKNYFSEITAIIIDNEKFILLFGDGYIQPVKSQTLVDAYKCIKATEPNNVVIPVYYNGKFFTTTHSKDFDNVMKNNDKWAKPIYRL